LSFVQPPPYSPGIDQITLENLLTHTGGGWTNDNRDPMFTHPHMDHTQLITWTLASRPLDRPRASTTPTPISAIACWAG
jgi:hypothetical protein